MSKNKLLLFIALLFLYNCQAQTSTIIYYTAVQMPEGFKSTYWGLFDTKFLAEDLAILLEKSTGKPFTVKPTEPTATKGIFLILDSRGKYLSNENGILESNGVDYIKFKAQYSTGLSYAMYSWLEELGFHFYLPGNEWAVIPTISSVFTSKITNKSYKPYFKLRYMGGSGAVPSIKGLDENMQNEKDWLLWYRRNRMGSDYMNIDGHIGEAFNITHKTMIEQDPSILAPSNGKRQYNVFGKLDPTNKKGVNLFSNWIADESKKSKINYPSFLPKKKYYTADAGDGLDYCYTAECLKQFKSVSNQVFSIVNESAKKIRMEDAYEGVSTYAYSQRADTPSIPIEQNVHVQVVASAFQTTSTQAGLMLRWAAKTKNLSQYDYLNICVWKADQPHFNLYEYHQYLQFLKNLKIEGMNFETSRSKFASGILQYFIIQNLCNPYQSIEVKMDEFCINNFGKAATPIKNLLKEWYFRNVHLETNYDFPTFYADELGRFNQYIIQAENSNGLKESERKRIDELKTYVIFLCKMYELRSEHENQKIFVSNPASRIEKEKEILNFTWRFYQSKIFHNTQLTDILLRDMDDANKANWDYQSDYFRKFKQSNSNSLIDIEFKKMNAKYLSQAQPLYSITEEFLKANIKNSADSFKISTMDETAVSNFIYPFQFYCSAPGILKINYKTSISQKPSLQKGKIALVAVEKDDYSFLKYTDINLENSNGIISYNLPTAGKYKLYLSQFDATHIEYVIYPGKSLFYHNKKSILMNLILMQDQTEKNNYSNKKIAVFVPAVDELKYSYLYWDCINTISFTSATGSPLLINTQKPSDEISISLKKDQQNNFIFYSNSQYRWPPVLVNTAPYYFFLKYPLKN
jgi:hypothetical protein